MSNVGKVPHENHLDGIPQTEPLLVLTGMHAPALLWSYGAQMDQMPGISLSSPCMAPVRPQMIMGECRHSYAATKECKSGLI